MKSTDVIEPLAITQPVATNGTKNSIPESATGSNLASIDEGFPDITMTALSQGGLPPYGQDFNGLFYLSTDQRTYLQNGGLITFNQNVSDTIGGYPQGAVLDYIDANGNYCKIKSLIDDNTYNFVTNPEYIDGNNWQNILQSNESVNKDLNNLTDFGNARLQYAPFAINSGTVDNGENATLSAPGSGTVIQTFQQPTLTSNGIMGESDFAASDYRAFDNNDSTQVDSSVIFYNKNPLLITNIYVSGYKNHIYVYSSDDNITWAECAHVTCGLSSSIDVPIENSGFHNYYKVTVLNTAGSTTPNIHDLRITGDEQISVSTADTIYCDPCVITTADGRTKEFTVTSRLQINDTEGETYVETEFVQPVLTSNGTLGGDSFAVDASRNNTNQEAWQGLSANGENNGGWSGSPSDAENYYIFYNPLPLNVKSISIAQVGSWWVSRYTLLGSNDGTTWSEIGIGQGSADNGYGTVSNFNSTEFYKYHKMQITNWGNGPAFNGLKITGTCLQEISGGDYSIFKDFSTGALSLGKVTISTATPTNPSSGDYWLDNSQTPLVLKNYSNSSWVVDNSKVLLGKCTIASGVVTALTNNRLNNGWNTTTPHIVKTYQNGTSWYRLYSDGWCIQGGRIIPGSSSGAQSTVTFLKPYNNTNYSFIRSAKFEKNTNTYVAYGTGYYTSSPSAVTFYTFSSADVSYYDWIAYGRTTI